MGQSVWSWRRHGGVRPARHSPERYRQRCAARPGGRHVPLHHLLRGPAPRDERAQQETVEGVFLSSWDTPPYAGSCLSASEAWFSVLLVMQIVSLFFLVLGVRKPKCVFVKHLYYSIALHI